MSREDRETVLASVIVNRIQELISIHGDVPIRFMEPMIGEACPMSTDNINFNGQFIEIWPAPL